MGAPVIDAGTEGVIVVKGGSGMSFTIRSYDADSPFTEYGSRQQRDEYAGSISGEFDGGDWEYGEFRFAVHPIKSTRYYVWTSSACAEHASSNALLQVRSVVTVQATRLSAKTFRFSGQAKGHDGDVINLYRLDAAGRPVLTSQLRTNAGRWAVDRRFTGTGAFTFYAFTGSEQWNVADSSARIRVDIR